MAMFQYAVKHVAKSSGSASLHPVPDLNSANHCQTLYLVKRKTSFWFWKKPKMIPTQITVQDLFEEDLKIPKSKSTVIMEDFSETPTLNIDGSFGSKIASELNLNLSGSDTMCMTIKLGDIVKNEIDWELLQEALETQRIKLNHPIFREVKKSKRTTLCVILESLATKQDGELSEVDDITVKTDDTGDVHKSVISVDITGKGDVENKVTHSFKIPPATVLAYSCNEFSINSAGMASLHSAIDVNDQLKDTLFLKNTDGADPVEVVRVGLQPLIKSEQFDKIRSEFKQLLEQNPSNDVLGAMHLLLAAAEFKIENKTEEKTLSASTVGQLFQDGENPMFNAILMHLGFALPENWDETSVIKFPEADYDIIKAVISFLDTLMDIQSDVRTLLPQLSQASNNSVLKIVLNEIEGKENKMSDDNLKKLFSSDPSAQLLLKNADFVEMKIDDEDILAFTRSRHFHLMDFYSVLYLFSH